jgi:hypothetical protein
MRSEECLIGGDDGFTCLKCSEDEFARRRNTTHHFNDDVDVGIGSDGHCIGRERCAVNTCWPNPRKVTNGDTGNLKRKSGASMNRGVLAIDERDE